MRRTSVLRRSGRYPLFMIAYFIIGIVVVYNRGYLTNLGTLPSLLSAIVTIILWPLLLLFGVHITF